VSSAGYPKYRFRVASWTGGNPDFVDVRNSAGLAICSDTFGHLEDAQACTLSALTGILQAGLVRESPVAFGWLRTLLASSAMKAMNIKKVGIAILHMIELLPFCTLPMVFSGLPLHAVFRPPARRFARLL
jgi:hypothetical protein